MFRSAIFVLLVALFFAPRAGWAQESSSSQAPVPELNQPAAAPQDSPELPPVTAPQPLPEHGAAKPVSDEVSAAEGAIAGSDWKAAEAQHAAAEGCPARYCCHRCVRRLQLLAG